jgi:hypothetical protein
MLEVSARVNECPKDSQILPFARARSPQGDFHHPARSGPARNGGVSMTIEIKPVEDVDTTTYYHG